LKLGDGLGLARTTPRAQWFGRLFRPNGALNLYDAFGRHASVWVGDAGAPCPVGDSGKVVNGGAGLLLREPQLRAIITAKETKLPTEISA
jgi:hypothetical protein